MALLRCPNCENKVSDRARKCPECDTKLKPKKPENSPEKDNKGPGSSEDYHRRSSRIGLIAFFILLIVVPFSCMSFVSNLSDEVGKTNSTTQQESSFSDNQTSIEDKFTFQNVTMKQTAGLIEVIGEVKNKGGSSYEMATFSVTLYKERGGIIDSQPANVTNLKAGETDVFKARFINIDPDKVEKYKVEYSHGF